MRDSQHQVDAHEDTLKHQQTTDRSASEPTMQRMPQGHGTQSMRQAYVLQMQRQRGNNYVRRMLQSDIQRQDEPVAGSNTQLGDGSATITAEGGKVSINAAILEVNAGAETVNTAMSNHSGLLKADTVVATNVIGSNYTPGAGNIW